MVFFSLYIFILNRRITLGLKTWKNRVFGVQKKKDFSKSSMNDKSVRGAIFRPIFTFFLTSIFDRLQIVSYDEMTR